MKICPRCNNQVDDNAIICPYCQAPLAVAVESQKAKTSKILGILALLLFAPLGIPAIILANSSKQETGGVMNKNAKTGLWCGIVALVVWGIMFLVMMSGM